MIGTETYQQKYKSIKKQYQLYDNFLEDENTQLTFEERSKLIYEMGRLIDVMKKIESMTYQETKKITDDHPLVLNSQLNYKKITLEP